VVLAAVALVASLTDAATLNKRARLREGPGKETRLLGWIDQGTSVEVEAERSGWYLIRSPDGQSGYVWQDHLSFQPAVLPPPGATATTAPPTAATSLPTTAAADTRPSAPADNDGVATELERLRGEVARLVTAQQELAQRVASGSRPAVAPIGSDGSAGAALLFFGVGAAIGWFLGRFGPGRRDRRSRLRV
jgi:uncharacterized protein YgiM (DUF1202 family)